MNKEKIFEMINAYLDDELTKAEEILLFTHLSADDEMRQVFKDCHLMKNALENSKRKFPEELENRILTEVLHNNSPRVKFLPAKILNAAIYAAVLVLIAISLFFYSTLKNYEQQMQTTMTQINSQKQIIELLMNSLPSSTVRAKLNNEIIIHSKS